MLKLTYIAAVLLATAFVSCEKKTAAPAQAKTTPPPVTKDTLSGKIYTFAGNGTTGFSGDNGPATQAELAGGITGIAVDASGNIYISDAGNYRIRKVDKNGVITTIAGNGNKGYSGDGKPAVSAEFNGTFGLAIDVSGNLYIADQGNQRIRKVNTSGIISTFAGNGIPGYSGDTGLATSAEIDNPYGLAVDDTGNIYIADCGNDRIRKINKNGIITTIAGKGWAIDSGDGGPATIAEIASPQGVAIDGAGNVYIADYFGNTIRKINKNGIISTIAGNGYEAGFGGGYSGDGGPATAAELNEPTDVAVDASGNVYFADAGNNRIRKVNTSGIISTYAGNGIYGNSGNGSVATKAEITFPQAIALDYIGNLYIACMYSNIVRVVYK